MFFVIIIIYIKGEDEFFTNQRKKFFFFLVRRKNNNNVFLLMTLPICTQKLKTSQQARMIPDRQIANLAKIWRLYWRKSPAASTNY